MYSMVNNNRIYINSKDKKRVETYVRQFLNDYIKKDLFLPKNKKKLRKIKKNYIEKIMDIVNTNKKATECFNKSLHKLCGKFFSKDKKIVFNTKELCKIKNNIVNC